MSLGVNGQNPFQFDPATLKRAEQFTAKASQDPAMNVLFAAGVSPDKDGGRNALQGGAPGSL
jgi:hypothetical protein